MTTCVLYFTLPALMLSPSRSQSSAQVPLPAFSVRLILKRSLGGPVSRTFHTPTGWGEHISTVLHSQDGWGTRMAVLDDEPEAQPACPPSRPSDLKLYLRWTPKVPFGWRLPAVPDKAEWLSWGWMELGWIKLSHLAALDTGWRTEDHHWPGPVLPPSQSVPSSRPVFSSHSNCVRTSEWEEVT